MDLLSPRKWALPINIIVFNLSKLIPKRNPRLWVFGGVEGRKFDDNSRFLFEHVCEFHNDWIRAIWISPNAETVSQVRTLGYEAYTPYCLKGIYYCLKAGVSVYSHALIDFGLFPLIGGSLIVSLWHGMGFKEIYNAKYVGLSLKLKLFLDSLFSWTYRNLTMVTSNYSKIQFQRLFNLKMDNIYITGQPRNDVLKRNLNKSNVLPTADATKTWILFMPTYRSKSMGEDAMSNIVFELYNNKRLNDVLAEHNYTLIVKLHPLTPHIKIKSKETFLVLDYSAVYSNQELLAVADILITDYSSCFVDFALTGKPIHFYCPDESRFLAVSEKMNKDFFRISGISKSMTLDGLISFLTNPTNEVCDATNEIFEDESVRGTCYSENVYNVICKKIGI